MKCAVCGTDSKGDARLCPGCGATLVVAKADETMLDLRTALFRRPVIVPAAPPATVVPPSAAVQQPTPAAAPPRSSMGGLVLVIIALGAIGYFVYQVAATFGTSKPPAKPTEARAPPPPMPMPMATPVTPNAQGSKADSAPPPATPPAVQMSASAPPNTPPVPAEPKPAPVAAEPRPAPVVVAPKPAPPPAPMASETPFRAAAPTPTVAPMPEPKSPRADRWQDMRDAFTRCRRENLISRTVCEQRVLFLYCDGYWGKVPQCPDAQNPDPRK